MIEANYKFSVAVDNKVRVVTRKYELPLRFSGPNLLNNLKYDRIIQVVFGLIDYQRRTGLIE